MTHDTITATQPIWRIPVTAELLNQQMDGPHIGKYLDIRFEAIGPDTLEASMPVDHRTHQPVGILHGGASVVLAETLGSIASTLCIDLNTHYAVGLEINANHLRPVRSGRVRGVCRPIHLGRSTHVWDIRLYDDHGKQTCASRLTCAIVKNEK